jgi:hypothetical protein
MVGHGRGGNECRKGGGAEKMIQQFHGSTSNVVCVLVEFQYAYTLVFEANGDPDAAISDFSPLKAA